MSVFAESKSYRPFTYAWAVDAAHKHEVDMYWSVHQINLQDDIQQYFSKDGLKTHTISHEQNKLILDRTLCLFTEMDRTVGEGYTKLAGFVKNNEIRNMHLRFASREVTHQAGYALCAETFGFSDKDWVAFSDYVEMVDKLEVMSKDLTPSGASNNLKASILQAQILLGEGIGLFGAFAVLLNMKRHGLLIGFNDVNEWSLKDEQEHVTNNIRTLAEMRKDLTEVENLQLDKLIIEFIESYKVAEKKYLALVFEMGGAEDLTLSDMELYIDYLGQLRKFQMDMISASEVPTNPLEWMEWLLSGNKHANFFEKKVVDYVHSGLSGKVNYNRYLDLVK